MLVDFEDGAPVAARDFVTGWQDASGERWGRPAGVVVAPDGSLIVSDDDAGCSTGSAPRIDRMSADVTGDSDRCPSGVYLIDAAEREQVLRRDAFPADFAIAVLDGTDAATRAGFFQDIARALHFPDYFGRNWDAVYDCLTDLNWLPAAGYVLVVDGFDQLATNDPEQWDIGLKVLREACA